VGDNSGTVIQCSVEGGNAVTISGGERTGGFAGNNTGTLLFCYATNNASASSSSSYSGGLTGYNDGIVSNCYATGNASSRYHYSGGLTGYNTGIISNCYATGNTSSSIYYSGGGGFVGYLYGGKISNCYSTGEVSFNNNKGAFAGYCENADYLSQCYYNSDINGTLAGVGNNVGNNNVLGITTSGMKLKTTFVNWDFYGAWGITESETYPYLYDNLPADIVNVIRGKGNVCVNSIKTYTADAGKSGYNWTITNGTIQTGQSTNQVTVKWNGNANDGKVNVSYGSIQISRDINLFPLPNPSISGNMDATVEITNFYSTEANMSDYVWTVTGGIILSGQGTEQISVRWNTSNSTGRVQVNYSNIGGCTATTDSIVTLVHLFGGGNGTANSPYLIKNVWQLSIIRGFPESHYALANDIDLSDFLENSTAGWEPIQEFSGSFDGRFFKIKGLWINQPNSSNLGLFARNRGSIENLYLEIDSKGIYGNDNIGGLASYNNEGIITQCCVSGGGITAKGDNIGGLVGYNEYGSITQSYSVNTTIWGNNKVGGLVGYNYGSNSKIHQCYAQNTVVGSNRVGGLTGSNDNSAVSQSYAAGIVSGGNFVGGLLGYNEEGTVTGCYYDEDVSEQYEGLGNPDDNQSGNIKAMYTPDMMKQKTFLAWDFNNVWKIDELEGYPYFRWQENIPVPPSGLAQMSINALRIYPNPTDGIVTVDCEPNSVLQVYNLPGKLLYRTVTQANRETVDLSGYPGGLYLIKAGNTLQKVIKK
jgi:hypothetical protein